MFRKNIEKSCLYCVYGEKLKSNEDLLCSKYGVTAARCDCRAFRYAPLKRIPEEKISFDFSDSDFIIDVSGKKEN